MLYAANIHYLPPTSLKTKENADRSRASTTKVTGALLLTGTYAQRLITD